MCFLTLEDTTGRVEVVVFSKTFLKNEHMLGMNQLIEISGKLEIDVIENVNDEGEVTTTKTPKILLYAVAPLESTTEIESLTLTVTKRSNFESIQKMIELNPGDIPLEIEFENFLISLPKGYSGKTEALSLLKDLCLVKENKYET